MRKTIFAFASALIILVSFGCNKDKDDNKISIVGKWTLQSATQVYYENGSTTPSDEYSYDPSTDGVSVTTLNADKTFTDNSDGDVTTGTYTYDADSKKLSLTPSGFPISIVYDVTQLNSSTMKWHYELSSTDDDGTPNKTVADATYTR